MHAKRTEQKAEIKNLSKKTLENLCIWKFFCTFAAAKVKEGKIKKI